MFASYSLTDKQVLWKTEMNDEDKMGKRDNRAWWVLIVIMAIALFVVADFFGYAELIWR